jgi:iron complex outermembrane receptor protein
VKFAVGMEQRREFSFDNPDSAIVNGDGNSDAAPTRGSYHVMSGYGDVLAPILKDAPFAKALNAEASLRYDHYNIFGNATTWKLGLDYAPVQDIRFRGFRSTAFRAPQVKELFGGAFQNAATATDPCSTGGAGGRGDAAGSAACLAALTAAGVNGQNFQSSLTQIETINGGNINLKPEKAKEYTIGGVITPRFLPGFSFGADYYNIDIENYIQALGTQDVLESCFLHNVPAACANITRQRGTGEVVAVLSSNINFGFQKTAGIDFDASYAFRVDQLGLQRPGTFTVDARSTLELHNYVNGAAGVNNQTATWQPSPAVIFEPRWRGLLGLTYAEDAWSVNVTERYIGAVTLFLGSPGAPGNDAPAIVYSDLAISYRYNNYQFVLGVNNLTDRDPPFLNDKATNSLGNGYDYVGRFIFLRVGLKL